MNYIQALAKMSSITDAQLDVLLLHRRVLSGKIKKKQAASARASGPVTLGAFNRVLQQGKENLRRAVLSIIVGVREGLIKPDELRKLIDLVARAPLEMPDEQQEAFVTLVLALTDKIVM